MNVTNDFKKSIPELWQMYESWIGSFIIIFFLAS
jgi:hypothetical protein